MKQLALSLCVVFAGTSLAQEIGTEITPTTPSSGVQNQNNPPPPPSEPPPASSGYVYKPRGAKEAEGSAWSGTKLSASSGDFGIRAGFGASGSTAIPAGSGATAPSATVGIAYFASDAFKLLVDLGLGMVLANNVLFSVSANVGFDYMFRTPGDALRPFFHFAGLFSGSSSGSNFGVAFGAQLGFGAEYFLAPNFSLNGRLLLAVPMSVSNNFVIGIFTVTPGLGATFYL